MTVSSPAPEVLDGRPAEVAADVCSLGSTLFTMLAGGPAFTRRPDETLAALFIPTTLGRLSAGGVRVGTDPTAVATDPRTGRIYVANSGSLSVTVLDGATREVVATVTLPSRPWGIALNHRTGRVYVTTAESAVTVIDTATNSVPSRPWAVAVIPETNRVYVTSQESRTLSVIDGSSGTVVANVDVRTSTRGVAANPRTTGSS